MVLDEMNHELQKLSIVNNQYSTQIKKLNNENSGYLSKIYMLENDFKDLQESNKILIQKKLNLESQLNTLRNDKSNLENELLKIKEQNKSSSSISASKIQLYSEMGNQLMSIRSQSQSSLMKSITSEHFSKLEGTLLIVLSFNIALIETKDKSEWDQENNSKFSLLISQCKSEIYDLQQIIIY